MPSRIPPPPREAGGIHAAFLEASPNAMVAVDEAARIAYLNPQAERTFGYSREELLGQPIELLLPERVADQHVAHRDQFLSHPAARPMGIGLDLAGRRKDGTEFPVEISLSPVRGADGLQVFATVVDITARKAAESQLLQAQKLESIGRLAGGIAHDFNNMLFAIRGFSELLANDLAARDDVLDRAAALGRVAAITDAADRATSLTTQLLAFSRQQVVKPKVLDLNVAVRSVQPMLRPLIGENIRVVLKLDPRTGHIRVDPSQFDQVLVNLAVNARDSMPDGGTITVETGTAVFDEPYAIEHFDVTAGSYAMLAITDTGFGMDRETREHVFEPFFTTKEQGKGTGLGLATIYGIVRQAGGHVWLYSEPGKGSSFKLYFPRVDDAVTEEEPAASHSGGGSGLILVVEDDPAVRDMTVQLLRRAGFEVRSVADGTAALAEIASASEPFDVLVTDVIMPNMSGIELAQLVHEQNPSVGIILLSGYTAETLDLGRATDHGAIFVAKPVTSSQLLDAIQRAAPGERACR
jgi:PAS domain S-box-containing protein